jgi:DNA (cytosine-5)-methyltransferase 1
MTVNRSIISLFSGAMGLDQGLEQAGFRTALAVEINKSAVQTIQLNKPRLPLLAKPIEKISSAEILTATKLNAGEPCLVTGGPCCQSFSTVGKRESFGNPRGNLFLHFKRIVAETQPRFFVMENVKGILSAAVRHRPLNDRGPGNLALTQDEQLGSALKVILRELAELKYYIVFGLVNAADYGVPQKRWRVIFIGSRDGEDIELPKPTHTENQNNCLQPWVTLRDAIGNLDEKKPEYHPFAQERLSLLKLLKAGENWTDLPKNLQRTALGAAYDSWGGRVGFCRRLDWNEPSPTLTTSPTGRATTLCHPSKLRPLTVGEYATLQQFPKDWQFSGSNQQKYIQIGNAVPVGLGHAIGKVLRKTMAKTEKHGLPKDAQKKRGMVVCDEALQKRITNRKKTQLHPARLLKNSDPKEIKKWLELAS